MNVEQIFLSGILPVMGGMGAIYRNCKRMAINALVEQMCEEDGVGFTDLCSLRNCFDLWTVEQVATVYTIFAAGTHREAKYWRHK